MEVDIMVIPIERTDNKIGDFIRKKRNELGLSRNALATAAGISHTELRRIETGERKEPSGSNLRDIAAALGISAQEIFEVAGLLPDIENDSLPNSFSGLKTAKQRDTISEIARGLARNSDSLDDEDLDDLLKQVNMFIAYAKDNSK